MGNLGKSVVRRVGVAASVVVMLALVFASVLAAAPVAWGDDGGSSGVGGGDLPGASGLGVGQKWFDKPGLVSSGQATYPQGTGMASADWFMNQSPRINDGPMRTKLQTACSQALSIAEKRGGSPARVVGIMWAYSNDQPYDGYDAARSGIYFQNALTAWANAGYPGFQGRSATSSIRTQARNLTLGAIQQVADGNMDSGANVSAICTALGKDEPPSSYDMNVATAAKNTFTITGGTGEVYDTVTTTAKDSSVRENLSGTVALHYGGAFPETNTSQTSRSKSFSGISNNGSNQRLPGFTPSDFGWSYWPAGKFWYVVSFPKQGGMNSAVTHGGPTTANEFWSARGHDLKITTRQANGFAVGCFRLKRFPLACGGRACCFLGVGCVFRPRPSARRYLSRR